MTKPERQDGDGLLKAARSRIGAMKIAPCSGLASSRAAAEELERALDYLESKPTRDAADGAAKYLDDLEGGMLARDADTPSQVAEWLRASAPPQPAPDAVREALASRIEKHSLGWIKQVEGEVSGCSELDACLLEEEEAAIVAALRSSAPVPSPDGATPKLHHDFEVSRLIREHQSPSATVAAEPVARTVSDEDWEGALRCAMSCLKDVAINKSQLDNAMQHAFGLLSLRKLAAPPVRGDRESLAVMLKHNGFTSRDGTVIQAGTFGVIDAILSSLPLQPSAGEREASSEQAFIAICDDLGCAYDNESALIALDNLKQRASGGESDLLRTATRMRDMLTADSDPPSVIVPDDLDANDFTRAFYDLAAAIREAK
jgi:hypothetical protein